MAPSDGRDWYVECAESPTIVKQELEFSCGAACARQLLADEGIDISEDEIRGAAAFEDGNGIYALSLAIALDQLMPNTNWNGVSVNEDSLDALLQRAPFIAMLDRHWVIVDSERDGSIQIRDPWGTERETYGRACTMKRDVFIARWIEGSTQVVYRDTVKR